jgi:hypothetical protein
MKQQNKKSTLLSNKKGKYDTSVRQRRDTFRGVRQNSRVKK